MYERDTLSVPIWTSGRRLPLPQLLVWGASCPDSQTVLGCSPIRTCLCSSNLYVGFDYEFRRKHFWMILKYISIV